MRQEGNCTYNDKKQGTKQMKQQSIVQVTCDSIPQNTEIKASTKTAPPIYQFLAQKIIKKHRTKGKLDFKTFSDKLIQETAQACT